MVVNEKHDLSGLLALKSPRHRSMLSFPCLKRHPSRLTFFSKMYFERFEKQALCSFSYVNHWYIKKSPPKNDQKTVDFFCVKKSRLGPKACGKFVLVELLGFFVNAAKKHNFPQGSHLLLFSSPFITLACCTSSPLFDWSVSWRFLCFLHILTFFIFFSSSAFSLSLSPPMLLYPDAIPNPFH